MLDRGLASHAGGPVDRVWYAADGSGLFARTASGRVWETRDFESWKPSAVQPPARNNVTAPGPEGSISIAHPLLASRVYAAGSFAYRSDNGGIHWSNLTRHEGSSILGGALTDIAVAPRNEDEVVVAGASGLWRSLDGGESWTGLNEGFPNLPVRRIELPPDQDTAVQIQAGTEEFVWPAGERAAWRPSGNSFLAREQALIATASRALQTDVTAGAISGDIAYIGTAEGLLLFSRDGGANWGASGVVAGAERVARIRINREDPNVAVAVTGSKSDGRVLRTNTAGVFWEDLTGNLPAGVVTRGVAMDKASGAIYLATDRGLYMAYTQQGSPSWTLLRAGPATDTAVGAAGHQLYAAFQDAGVFGTLAPHRLRDPRVVSAADHATRPAAPGSLLSVIGARVNAARIGDRVAPVLAASDAESQIQVPFDTPGSAIQLAADTASGNLQFGFTVFPTSPSIFIDQDGVPLVMNADTGLVLDPSTPARSGSRLQILMTGLGRVQPEWPTGLAAPIDNAPRVVSTVRALLDREPVEVSRATLAPGYIGMYLVEVQLPAIVNRGTAELYIEAEGRQSNRIRIHLEP